MLLEHHYIQSPLNTPEPIHYVLFSSAAESGQWQARHLCWLGYIFEDMNYEGKEE